MIKVSLVQKILINAFWFVLSYLSFAYIGIFKTLLLTLSIVTTAAALERFNVIKFKSFSYKNEFKWTNFKASFFILSLAIIFMLIFHVLTLHTEKINQLISMNVHLEVP